MSETNDWASRLSPDVLALVQRGLEQAYRQGVEDAAKVMDGVAKEFGECTSPRWTAEKHAKTIRGLSPLSPEPKVTLAKVREAMADLLRVGVLGEGEVDSFFRRLGHERGVSVLSGTVKS